MNQKRFEMTNGHDIRDVATKRRTMSVITMSVDAHLTKEEVAELAGVNTRIVWDASISSVEL